MKETLRQVLHLLFGLFFIFLTAAQGPVVALYFVAVLAVIGGASAILIFRGIRVPLASSILQIVERSEESSFPGKAAFKFLAGIGLALAFSLWISRPEIAAPALVPMALGDSFATIVGKRIGRIRLMRKSLEGAAAFFVATMVGYTFILPTPFFPALTTAIVALFAELFPLEDNFSVPLVSAITLSFIF